MAAETVIPEGTVTVLFTDLVGSTTMNQQLGDENSRSIERSVEQLVMELVGANRGVPIKEIGDGVMAAFGSARRAVTCAREIQRAMVARNRADPAVHLQMRIGLHTGEVLSENGDLHGETVIIAKRIESLAPPGGVLASATVQLVLGTARDELVDRGEFELKGIASRWRLFEVPCAPTGTDVVLGDNRPTPFTGRQHERARLQALVREAATGTGALVLISGEAGAGKSRLAAEAVAEAQRHQMTVLTGQCLDLDVPPPYQPLLDQLEQAAQQTTSERMRVALGENAAELATLMPVLRQRYDDIPETPSLPPDQERQYVLHGVQAFMKRAAANRPVLLLFEDLHWADESSLLLLEHLAPVLGSMGLLVIGTYRHTDLDGSRPMSRSLANLARGRHAVEIRLPLLGRDDVGVLLANRAGRPPPAELVDVVHAETDGNPLFVEEVFRHLHEAGKLFDEGGQWVSGVTLSETEVPRGVQRVIARRLEQLSSGTRRLLAIAAVIGRTFSFDLLAAVSTSTDDAIFEALEEAAPLGLITESVALREASYVFVHEQFRQSLLGELSLPRRQRLHVGVADALERRSSPSSSTSIVAVANHLELAGSAAPSERTAAALVGSATSALDALAFEDALRVVQRALTYLDEDDHEGRARVAALLARALRGSGQVEEALTTLDRALAPLSSMSDSRARLLLQRAALLLDQFRAEPTLEDLALLLEHYRRAGDQVAELEVLLALGRAHYILSLDRRESAEPCRASYAAAHQLAEHLEDKASMARALLPTAWFIDYWPDYRTVANENLREALRLSQELGNEDLIIDCLTTRLRVGWENVTHADAEALQQRLESRRDPVRLKEFCFWMMWYELAAGEFRRCVDVCDRGLALATQLAAAPVQYGSIKSMALVELGRFDAVDDAIAQEVTDDHHPFGQAMAHVARLTYLERLGAFPEAIECALTTHPVAVELSRFWMQRLIVNALTSVRARLLIDGEDLPFAARQLLDTAEAKPMVNERAELLLRIGSPRQALELLAPTTVHLEQVEHHRRLTAALLTLAEIHLALDDHHAAEIVCRHGLDIADRHEQGSLIWQLRLVLACALEAARGRGGEARQERDRAGEERAVLAARIADPVLRDRFERTALSSRWGPR